MLIIDKFFEENFCYVMQLIDNDIYCSACLHFLLRLLFYSKLLFRDFPASSSAVMYIKKLYV
jgi:hypothetical protein